MVFEIIDHDVIDSNGTHFKALVRLNFTEDNGSIHLCELKVDNCNFKKSCIRKDDLRVEYIEICGDARRFEENDMEDELGYEAVSSLKNQLEFYFKRVLKD